MIYKLTNFFHLGFFIWVFVVLATTKSDSMKSDYNYNYNNFFRNLPQLQLQFQQATLTVNFVLKCVSSNPF